MALTTDHSLTDEEVVAGFLQRNCAMSYEWCLEVARRLLVALETKDVDA